MEDIAKHIAVIDGHADIWRLFADARVFREVVERLAAPFRNLDVTAVAGIEARGFILGAAVAYELGTGFVAIRKPEGLYPGEKISAKTATEYRGRQQELRLKRDLIDTRARLVLVDDWFETGSQVLAAQDMIKRLGGTVLGAAVIVDQLPQSVVQQLGRYHYLLRANEIQGL